MKKNWLWFRMEPELTKLLKKMKLTVFLLFVTILGTMAAESYSQSTKLTVDKTNSTVKEILNEIENSSEFRFFYSGSIDVERRTSISVKESKIFQILDELFKGTDVAYEVRGRQIALVKNSESFFENYDLTGQVQQINLSGKVTDANDLPLPGVTVIIKGTTQGTVTDINGNYSLANVFSDATIQFSFVGMKTQEIEVRGESVINVKLEEDAIGIEEVVAVGYGTAKKKDLAGSIVRADMSALQESPNVSLGSALQGIVPGLNVGATTSAGSDPYISIRGRTSISGGGSPLIVLDGIIYRGNLVDINMNDVESVDILKDASAAAIYGSQASNGVILINSKKSQTKSKPIIEYSGSFSLQDATNDKMVPMDRDGFLQLIADFFLNESRTGTDMLQENPNWDVSSYLMDSNAVNGYLNGTNTNWWKMLTNEHPYINMHNLSIKGKSELSSYFMSIGFSDQENLIINDTYQRYNLRLNLDTKITDWLRIGTQSFFTQSDYSGIAPEVAYVTQLPPVCAVTDENGDYITYPYKSMINPMLEIDQENVDKRYNLFANFYADIDIPFVKGLNYRMNYSQNLINNKYYIFSAYGNNLTGSASKTNDSGYTWSLDNILTYKRTFEKHDVNATFVYGAEEQKYETTTASGKDFGNDKLGYNYLEASNSELQSVSSSASKENSLYSMLRLAYTYNDRYIFTGTIRRDGFSGFGAENKFALFPSVALGWRISEEDFFKNSVNWVDNMKIRLSYGSNGNRTVSSYQTLATMSSTDAYLYGDGGDAEKGMYISSMSNENLKWETTNSFNMGVDFSIFNQRIFGSLEYYQAKTHDLLYDIDIPYMNNGISSIATNIGEMSNHGFEFSITGRPVKTRDLQWDVTANFSLNRNKIETILGLDDDGDGKEDDLVSSKIFIGHPYGVCYDFKQTSMWQLEDYNAGIIPDGFTYGTYKVEDINEDGNYTAADDREILGYTDPSYRFSIQNTLRYKNWEFKMLVNSVQGGKNYYYGQPGSELNNTYENNSFKWDYWTPENPDARYRQPGYYSAALGSDYSPYIQRSFIRLQDVTLSYSLPEKWLNKLQLRRVKVYVSGKNLLTLTDWDGWDPETGTGFDYWSYPLLRSYSLGVNLEF